MGSPSSRLDTDEKFRPWVDAGLEYIFAPGHAEQVQVGQSASQAPQQAAMQQVQQAPQQPVQPQVQVQQPSQTQQHNFAPQGQQQYQAAQTSVPPVQQPSAQASVPPHHNVRFPDPWNVFLSKVKATAPKVVCTYMELGLDLGGQPDPKRGGVLRNTLTNHLKWPAGTAAFWPMSALVNGALQPNKEMFWKGWELWKTPYIVCFGEEALNVIHPASQPGGTTYLLEEISILGAPPLAKLVTMLPHEQQISTELLSAVRI